jgi:hypothetical protein
MLVPEQLLMDSHHSEFADFLASFRKSYCAKYDLPAWMTLI